MKKNILLLTLLILAASPLQAQTSQSQEQNSQIVSSQKQSYASLVEKVLPAVVSIEAEHSAKEVTSNVASLTSDNPVLRDYFIFDEGGKISHGSGFVIDAKGYIITNYHVIKDADKITVNLGNEGVQEAQVIGFDEPTDLALLKVKLPYPLRFAELGDSDKLKVGDVILTAGNAFGLGTSFSTGIVSAKSRDIDMGVYDNFIQTDAAINQGSSGGPMFDMEGKVVGINNALYSSTGESVGVGFAIPINLSKFVIARLLEKGKVERSWIGVYVANQDKKFTISDNQKFSGGVSVSSVNPNSPAQQAGVEAGDIIMALNGVDIKNIKDFSRRIAELPIGHDIILRLWRSNQIKDITLRTALRPVHDKPELPVIKEFSEDSYVPNLGIAFASSGETVLIRDVLQDSQAYNRGIKSGDVVSKINSHVVKSVSDALSYISYANAGDGFLQMTVISNGTEHKINMDTKPR